MPASRRPIEGAGSVARLLARFPATVPDARVDTVWLNGAPAALVAIGGEVDGAISLTIVGGRITRIDGVWNPHKLTRVDTPASLAR